MDTPVNLAEKLSSLEEGFAPRIVGYFNDSKVQHIILIEPKGTPNVGDAEAEAAPEVEI